MIAPPAEPQSPGAALSVLVVADGGGSIGFGHLSRCLAVAQELGGRCAFATGGSQAGAWLTDRGARITSATTVAPVTLLDRVAPATVEEVAALQAAGGRVALLDDPGPARALADLVIDPPTGVEWPPAGGRRLAGFEHALVRRDIRDAASARPRPGAGVLLTLGGSDPEGLTPVLAEALVGAGLACTPVLGPGYRGPPVAGALRDPADFARALASADIVVTGFGHTLVEAAHLGVASIALALRGNDAGEASAFCRHGCATWLDGTARVDPEEVVAAVLELRDDDGARRAMSTRGRALVDGRGAARVAAALRELA
jgi:spore coat polysaccharide biosynthesis protein SpsF